MPSIRIAHLSNFSPKKLGTGENRIVAMAAGARERGHRLTLFGGTPVHPDVDAALREAGARWEPIQRLKESPLRASRSLATGFDVLQMNMIPPRSRIALAAYLAWPAKVLFVDRVSGPPGVPSPPRALPFRLLDRVTMARVHQVGGITEYVRARAASRFGLGERRSCTVYNGVDTERFTPNPDPPPREPLRILTVASLIPEKGVDVLLEAVARLPAGAWRLSVVGEGPQEGSLRSLVGSLGIQDEVSFLGLRDDVPGLMQESHVFVHPAIWQEALGNTVLEAMASGLGLIASRVGGIPELVREGTDGILVEAGRVEILADALETLLENPDLCSELGKNARERAVHRFSLQASISRHLDWCEMAAAGRFLS